jgi:glutamate-ammonia-ligase adenylyltransferase
LPQPTTIRSSAALSQVHVLDRERAEKNLEQIRARVPKAVAEAVATLLAEVPDGDSALNFFERLTESAPSELFLLFEKRRSLVHYALTVFGYSQYLGETLLHNHDLLPGLLREKNLDRSYSRGECREAFARFRSRSFETDMAQLLARFKRREYVRIVLRDVLGLAPLSETTGEISALSDALIEEALCDCAAVLHSKYGSPHHRDKHGRVVATPFAVLALGKLGGNELNYSSDVDLMFLYGDGESLPGASITNREYFVRLAQQVTDVLSGVTKEGFVFRIDLRLRPQGREGESAISVGQALRYYVESAQDWERQAMIKVRHCAGDVPLARQFIRKIQDSVYTEQVNFVAIETALQARDRTRDRRKSARQEGIDVKLDRGGIRDIEFLVQCLQRVYGGKEKWLRSGGTLFSLQKLHDKQHISGSDFQQLTTAYEFLRTVEHRLQLRQGQQTHRLPTTPDDLGILARSLRDEPISAENVANVIRQRMNDVSAIYDRIIHHQQQQTTQQVSDDFELRTLDLSFGRVKSDRQILQRLASDNRELYDIASRSDLEAHTRRNLFRFLSSALTSPERYASVAEAPQLLEKALPLFRQSEFLTDILVQHPEDFANIGDLRQWASKESGALFAGEEAIPINTGPGVEKYLASGTLDYGAKLALLRRRFRQRMFLSGARDVIETRAAAAAFADNTSAAEEAISAAFTIAGIPGMAVMALGRLGTREFDCLSDADLLFVRDKSVPADDAVRAAEQMMHVLSAYTKEGTVLAVDVRLRPHGKDGELTVTPAAIDAYLNEEGQAWEAITYTKLRHIAGDTNVASEAIDATISSPNRFGTVSSFAKDLREMRGKLEGSEPADNFKTGRGGVYDIDFLVGYLLVRHGIPTTDENTRERLQKLARAGLLSTADPEVLLNALDFWRTLDHVTRLATGKPQRSLPVAENARRSVQELVIRLLPGETAANLDHIVETRNAVRSAFDRLVR